MKVVMMIIIILVLGTWYLLLDENCDDDDDDYNPAVAPAAPGTGRHPFPLGAAGSGD